MFYSIKTARLYTCEVFTKKGVTRCVVTCVYNVKRNGCFSTRSYTGPHHTHAHARMRARAGRWKFVNIMFIEEGIN